jgi:hypothetical protein
MAPLPFKELFVLACSAEGLQENRVILTEHYRAETRGIRVFFDPSKRKVFSDQNN